MGSRRGEENHVIAVTRHVTGTCRLSEDALATVAVDGIAKTLWRDEGAPSGVALVAGS